MNSDADLIGFYINLTARQREVVYLVSQGLSNREIASQLCIAPSVVAEHLSNIYALLPLLDEGIRPNRYTLIRLFTTFFERYPEMTCFGT